MKFNTKLWKRSQKSFATTIPHVVLFQLDESKEHDVVWEYNPKLKKWTVDFKPSKSKSKSKKKAKK